MPPPPNPLPPPPRPPYQPGFIPWHPFSAVSGQLTPRDESGSYEWHGELCLFGGRGTLPIDCLNPGTGTWVSSLTTTDDLHHVQPVVYNDEVWVVTGFTGVWPGPWNENNKAVRERSLENVYVFDPKADRMRTGCEIPMEYRRGSAGVGKCARPGLGLPWVRTTSASVACGREPPM